VKLSTGVVDMSFMRRRSKNASAFEREIFGKSFENEKDVAESVEKVEKDEKCDAESVEKDEKGVADNTIEKVEKGDADNTIEKDAKGDADDTVEVEEDIVLLENNNLYFPQDNNNIICVLDEYPNEKFEEESEPRKDEKFEEDEKFEKDEKFEPRKDKEDSSEFHCQGLEEEMPSQVMERMREVIARKPWLESNWVQLEAELKEESSQAKALREHGHESIFQTLAMEFGKDEKFEEDKKFEKEQVEDTLGTAPNTVPSDAIIAIQEGAKFGTDHQLDILESLNVDPTEACHLMNIIFAGMRRLSIDSQHSI
jgi:hypothetical protein